MTWELGEGVGYEKLKRSQSKCIQNPYLDWLIKPVVGAKIQKMLSYLPYYRYGTLLHDVLYYISHCHISSSSSSSYAQCDIHYARACSINMTESERDSVDSEGADGRGRHV